MYVVIVMTIENVYLWGRKLALCFLIKKKSISEAGHAWNDDSSMTLLVIFPSVNEFAMKDHEISSDFFV